jgi:hypothetical protein
LRRWHGHVYPIRRPSSHRAAAIVKPHARALTSRDPSDTIAVRARGFAGEKVKK